MISSSSFEQLFKFNSYTHGFKNRTLKKFTFRSVLPRGQYLTIVVAVFPAQPRFMFILICPAAELVLSVAYIGDGIFQNEIPLLDFRWLYGFLK